MSPPTPERKQGSPGGDSGYDFREASPGSDLVRVKGNDVGISSTLEVNLGPYIASHEKRDDDTHLLERTQLVGYVSGAGVDLWGKVLTAALEKAAAEGRLSTEDRGAIIGSPARQFMANNFVELVKNLMDEAILGHYEGGKEPRLELNLNIDVSQPDRVKMTITDNGRGFPAEFVDRNATDAGKDAYIKTAGSAKSQTHEKPTLEGIKFWPDTTPPKLFGGAGLGLRNLIAEVLHGSVLAGQRLLPMYEKPTISEISLSNRAGGSGAIIEITTSRTPLQMQEKWAEHDAGAAVDASAAPMEMATIPKKVKKSPAPSVTSKMKEEMAKLRRPLEESPELADKESSDVRPR